MRLNVSEKKQRTLVIVFFIVLALAGFWMGTDYGVPWDETSEQRILAQNFHEYAYQLLGSDNPIVLQAKENGATFISENVERDHGVAPFYLLAPIFLMEDAHLVTQTWHAYIWLLFMVGVAALYMLMRELGASRMVGCAAVLLLYLSPRFFAEGHYNNKDVVLLSLVLCIFACASQLMRKRSFLIAMLFSLAGAFAANVKMIGIFAWGVAGLAVLWKWMREKKLSSKDFSVMIVAILGFIGFYFLITPAMWNDPIGFFEYLFENMNRFSRWNGAVVFQGEMFMPVQGELLPWYYLPYMIMITVPVPYLLLALTGQIYAVLQCIKGNRNSPLLIALTVFWILPLVYEMVSKPIIYNGWRHFYFIYAGLVAMGGLGIFWFFELAREKRVLKSVFILSLAVAFMTQTISILANHPYQYAYFNALAGQSEGSYELDYWALSTYNAMDKLVSDTTRNQDLPLIYSRPSTPPINYPVANNQDALPVEKRNALEFTDDYVNAPYLIYNTTYALIAGLDQPAGYKELFSIRAYHHELVIVYEKEAGNLAD